VYNRSAVRERASK